MARWYDLVKNWVPQYCCLKIWNILLYVLISYCMCNQFLTFLHNNLVSAHLKMCSCVSITPAQNVHVFSVTWGSWFLVSSLLCASNHTLKTWLGWTYDFQIVLTMLSCSLAFWSTHRLCLFLFPPVHIIMLACLSLLIPVSHPRWTVAFWLVE